MERKLETDEQASKMEKIILLCSEIVFSANSLNEIIRAYDWIINDVKNNTESKPEIHIKRQKHNEEVLDFVIKKLYKTRETVCNYINDIDAVSVTGAQFGNVVYNTVNDLIEIEEE